MRKFLWPMLAVISACTLAPRGEAPPATAPVPAVPAPAPAAPGEAWKIVAAHLELRVYRDGPMQKLGHDHLISTDGVTGEVTLREPAAASSFLLHVPLESLVVDDGAARAAAGGVFSVPVPAQDAEGTRHNMLGEKLLDAARYPVMTLASESVTDGAAGYEARVRVSLAGSEHVVAVPFTLSIDGGILKAHAGFSLTHADVGLHPFAVALGALRVRDDFDVDLTLEARPAA